MNKMFMKVITLALTFGAVVACGETSSIITSTPAGNPTTVTPTTQPQTVLTNDDFERGKTTFIDAKGNEKSLNMQTIYTNAGSPHLDSLETQRIMVVPFGFEDPSTVGIQTQENLDRINKTFFATSEEIKETGIWTSVAEYYNRSSYGKAKFEGAVLPTWVTYPGTVKEYERYSAGKTGTYGFDAAKYARDWYVAEYKKENHGSLGADAEPLSYFDANRDGFIDLIWVVYSAKTGKPGDWWAYVTYDQSANGNTSAPTVKTLGFAGIDWMNKSDGGYDPHTFIHETGHTYGLDDYYDYTNSWSLMGKVDMMDNNIGDHNAFSKFSLGWLNPMVIDLEAGEKAELTLYPTTLDENSTFLIPSPGYNGTAFDEYLLVDFVAPVGLNERDYKLGYESIKGYTVPGLRVMHVDARVYAGNRDTYLKDNPHEGKGFRIDNSKGGRMGLTIDGDYIELEDGSYGYYSLLSLIESTVNKEMNCTVSNGYNANNDSLFKQNERFTLSGRTGKAWAETFMPSKTNLWNKSKTITGWQNVGGKDVQIQEVDKTCTMDYAFKVTSIVKDDVYGYKATVEITKNA